MFVCLLVIYLFCFFILIVYELFVLLLVLQSTSVSIFYLLYNSYFPLLDECVYIKLIVFFSYILFTRKRNLSIKALEIIIIIIIIIHSLELFTSALAEGFSLESE